MTRDVPEAEWRAAERVGWEAYGRNRERGIWSYLLVRALPDGRQLTLLHWRAAGLQLSVGRGGFYTDTWIYDAEQGLTEAGWRAALGWDGEGEPEGWWRHVQSGRRRPEGDANKEYVQR